MLYEAWTDKKEIPNLPAYWQKLLVAKDKWEKKKKATRITQHITKPKKLIYNNANGS